LNTIYFAFFEQACIIIPTMNSNNVTQVKFADEGKGYSLSSLPTGYTAVYYGFNCTPRQVKYYKVEQSCKDILAGSASRSTASAWLAKVKELHTKALARREDLGDGINRADEAMRNGSRDASEYARKERNRLENAWGRHEYKVTAFADCIKSVEAHLAE
jgi:hypothetical protein